MIALMIVFICALNYDFLYIFNFLIFYSMLKYLLLSSFTLHMDVIPFDSISSVLTYTIILMFPQTKQRKESIINVNVSVRDNFCILFGINVYYFPLFYYDVINVIATTSGTFIFVCLESCLYSHVCYNKIINHHQSLILNEL